MKKKNKKQKSDLIPPTTAIWKDGTKIMEINIFDNGDMKIIEIDDITGSINIMEIPAYILSSFFVIRGKKKSGN